MHTTQTREQIADAVARAIRGFNADVLEEVASRVDVSMVDDLIIVRLYGVLTPAERRLAGSPDGPALIKQFRSRLLDNERPRLVRAIAELTQLEVQEVFTDVHVASRQQVIVLAFAPAQENPGPHR